MSACEQRFKQCLQVCGTPRQNNSMADKAQMQGSAEGDRLQQDKVRKDNWKRWGPYLSDRQWGTVREDYSPDGTCWDYFTHDQARSRAYRWGEDGILGVTDRECRLCFAVALWNGKDPILKERLYGLTGSQGNHGEDVKELYYHLDCTPTMSYAKGLYKYPQAEYPYSKINEEGRNRGKGDLEYEVEDAGLFDENKYWDVEVEYAKSSSQNVLARISVHNRGPEEATLHVLPTLWFRNSWIWGCKHEGCTAKPRIAQEGNGLKVRTKHDTLEEFFCEWGPVEESQDVQLLFTENETNTKALYGQENYTPYVKDAFHRYVVNGEEDAVSPKKHGTKVSAYYTVTVPAGGKSVIRTRMYQHDQAPQGKDAFADFDKVFELRKKEADEFYSTIQPQKMDPQLRNVQRQAYAGMLWSRQFYHYVVNDWLHGDPDQPKPPASRLEGRNREWDHLFNRDVISMPDKWEYPWYASWDLAFHTVPLANVDYEFAKSQLLLFLREWYMHPNGQIPAYEFALGDVNPPVHAWACNRLFHSHPGELPSKQDVQFLESVYLKLILNFTWWVNRKDPNGRNLFAGGFLGLDNIGVFDRSKPLPADMMLEQADGTAWMAFFCAVMLDMSIELALKDPVYEDMASKFFEHSVYIIDAINNFGGGKGLWDETDGFYYDHIRHHGNSQAMKLRSLVGLVPIFSVLVLEKSTMEKLPSFAKRTQWFVKHRKDLVERTSFMQEDDQQNRFLLAVPTKRQLERILAYMFDEDEFLSEYGIRSMSKFHEKNPFTIQMQGEELRAEYTPGESNSYLFGGNSNWRGPIWFPMNFLIIISLQRFDYYYGDSLKVEVPARSGNFMRLKDAADELCERLAKIFTPDAEGIRPCHGKDLRLSEKYAKDPHFKDLVLFYEYFHGDNGRGCGASHQTGWTGLIVNCINILSGLGHQGVCRPADQ